jgi:hypothetical protein
MRWGGAEFSLRPDPNPDPNANPHLAGEQQSVATPGREKFEAVSFERVAFEEADQP